MATLRYGLYNNRGFTALIAPPGMGKTTLLFTFLEHIRGSARSVFIFDTQCEPRELIRYILRDLGIVPGSDIVEMHEQLKEVLVATARMGQRFVLAIDEAQNLPNAALETVRLLSNFETPTSKLIQIVLAGQPQLSERLMTPSLLQLRQRISAICKLAPLSKEETRAYIDYRLGVAGYVGASLFTDDALNLIIERSMGIPRVVNNLCFNALSLCCALKRRRVDGGMAKEVLADQQLETQPAIINSSVELPLDLPCKAEKDEGKGWRTALWVPLIAAATVLLAVGIFESPRHHDTQYAHSEQTRETLTSFPEQTATKVAVTRKVADPSQTAPILEVTVKANESLSDIAVHNHLGSIDIKLLNRIQSLNPSLTDPDHIEPGQTLRLPKPSLKPAEDVTSKNRVRNLP
jgi:type II secretory pathway predicted ATPase ExeA/LysM repeat protein